MLCESQFTDFGALFTSGVFPAASPACVNCVNIYFMYRGRLH
ncbi:hypothetical protein P186_1429 [Pyrobaculum ferrireducens]|uniref:Uncharacterized protein n=1 Tax=Pyrobaculum ferrireducens TaxID=1104324 RepID=G7VEN8_9CREN|nr:hypothetical protein P186_1429 [Pyrobaculum ferrireducens]